MHRDCCEEVPVEVVPEQKAIPDATLAAVAAAAAVAGTRADAVAEVAIGSGFEPGVEPQPEPEPEAPGLTRVASAMVLEAAVGGQPRRANEQGPEVEVPGSGLAQGQVREREQMEQKERFEQPWEVHW